MLLIALLAMLGNGYQYQSGFDFCLKHDYKFQECSWHKKMVEKNPKSKHHR